MFIQWIAKIFVAINSNTRPREIALGISFAFLLGIMPFLLPAMPPINLLWLLLFFIAFFIKLNQAMFGVFLALFKLLAPLLYPVTSWIGFQILTIPALEGFFTSLNNIPVIPFTYFNSPLVIGGLVVGSALFVPLVLLSSQLLRLYRDKLREKLANSKLVKGFLKIPIIKKLSQVFGGAISFYQGIRG